VRGQAFSVGDLVLRLRQDNRVRHKLTPPWEGPFVVTEVLQPGTNKLATTDGKVFTNAWNIEQPLEKLYEKLSTRALRRRLRNAGALEHENLFGRVNRTAKGLRLYGYGTLAH
jgi:hypothetical protein